VGGREIGFLFGQYKRIRNAFECSLTGKGSKWGGSLIRPEATGYGLVYFAQEMLATKGLNLAGMRVTVSGFGNVAWGAIKKINELGGRVITLSGPDGYVHDADGVVGDKVDFLLKMRGGGNDRVEDYARQFKVPFVPNARPWEIPCDVALPCATQNEMDAKDARTLIKNGVKCIAEGANLPLTLEAQRLVIDQKIPYAPGKAANAGGVAVSGLEMTQNSTRLKWAAETVDSHLKQIMKDIHATVSETAKEFNQPGNYLAGANIAAICLVADAMLDQGVV
jgi:glutamate dehydrogenase (NADP+)